jgi:hypothetical protein
VNDIKSDATSATATIPITEDMDVRIQMVVRRGVRPRYARLSNRHV